MKKRIQDICKGKDLASNLKWYRDTAVSAYSEYASLELTFSAYTMLQEVVEEKPELAAREDGAVRTLLDALRAMSAEKVDYAGLMSAMQKLRDDITGRMDFFTACTDRLIIYEYVMNRMELSFETEKKLDEWLAEKHEDNFLQQLLLWMYAGKDQNVLREKQHFVIGQIPVQMTKAKFFEKISEALTLYKGSEKASLDDFIYMIRTSAMLYEPSDHTEEYAETVRVLQEFDKTDFSDISRERYEELADLLEKEAHDIHEITDFYYTMQKVVNAIYALCVLMPYAEEKGKLILACESIWRCLSGKEYMDEMLVPLEGRIEDFVEKTSYLEAALIEMKSSYQEEIDRYNMKEFFEDLTVAVNLLSDSLFIDLEKVRQTEIADDGYVRQRTEELLDELSARMAQMSRPVKRAVMGAVLEKLPTLFQTSQEMEEYIRVNLLGCRNKSEKLIVMSILADMMSEGM